MVQGYIERHRAAAQRRTYNLSCKKSKNRARRRQFFAMFELPKKKPVMNINHRARHDQFFKHHFSHKEQVIDYLKAKMPAELLGLLNLSTLEKKKDTFLANRLRGPRQADVIWSTRPKGEEELLFFFHLEGQSKFSDCPYAPE